MNTTQSWDPILYDDRARFVSTLAKDDLVDLLAPGPDDHVLDLGCGTGDLAILIAARGARVVGVDASAAMIAAARAKAPGISFSVADGQSLGFDKEFTAVFSNAALHWMRRPDDVAAGMARALRPGGRLVVEFGGHGCCAQARAAIGTALGEAGMDPSAWEPWYFPRLGAYTALLERHGFEVRAASLFDRPTPIGGEDGLGTWMRLFANRLLDELGDRAQAVVRRAQELARAALFSDGVWSLDYVRLRVSARTA